jgi:predicted GIY-YIG superfamily endonuclease
MLSQREGGPILTCPRRSKDYGLAGQQMQAFFYVHILASDSNEGIHYTGVTRDLKQRVFEHNQGKCPNFCAAPAVTNRNCRRPFRSQAKARAFEEYLKSGSGRAFARRHF